MSRQIWPSDGPSQGAAVIPEVRGKVPESRAQGAILMPSLPSVTAIAPHARVSLSRLPRSIPATVSRISSDAASLIFLRSWTMLG